MQKLILAENKLILLAWNKLAVFWSGDKVPPSFARSAPAVVLRIARENLGRVSFNRSVSEPCISGSNASPAATIELDVV